MTRCLFAFALAFAGLIVISPLPAHSEVRRQCLKSCTILEITRIEQVGAAGKHIDHRYEFLATCEHLIGVTKTQTRKSWRIESNYSPLTQLGTEKIFAGKEQLAFESSFRCNGDPFRGSGRCTETGRRRNTVGEGSYKENWDACFGVTLPILGREAAKVNVRVAEEMAAADLPGPIILSPSDGEEILHFGLGTVEVKHPPSMGWFTNHTFLGRVELSWFYLGPDGQSRMQHRGEAILPREISGISDQPANRAFAARRLDEGLWKVLASFPQRDHSGGTSEVSFWVGDRVDAALPAPTIQMPMEEEHQAADPVIAYAYFKDREFVERMRFGSIFNHQALKLESEFMSWDPEARTWKWDAGSIIFSKIPYGAQFELWRAGEGKFRFRVRHERKDGGPGYPWSVWRTYYVGELGKEIRTAERISSLKAGSGGAKDTAPDSGDQVGTEMIQGKARTGSTSEGIRTQSPGRQEVETIRQPQ